MLFLNRRTGVLTAQRHISEGSVTHTRPDRSGLFRAARLQDHGQGAGFVCENQSLGWRSQICHGSEGVDWGMFAGNDTCHLPIGLVQRFKTRPSKFIRS
jgi:hypothetical protein